MTGANALGPFFATTLFLGELKNLSDAELLEGAVVDAGSLGRILTLSRLSAQTNGTVLERFEYTSKQWRDALEENDRQLEYQLLVGHLHFSSFFR